MKFPIAIRIATAIVVVSLFIYFLPLFRIRKIDSQLVKRELGQHVESGSDPTSPASATSLIDSFWNEQLPESVKNATTLEELLEVATRDAKLARRQFGREVGLGGPTYFFVRGNGTIDLVDDNHCRLAIAGKPQRVILQIGPLAGNVVRDATGLVRVENFPSSQDFNHVSAELNQRCEEQVIGPVRSQLVAGAQVAFAGCGKISDGQSFDRIEWVPVQLVVTTKEGQRE